MPNFPKIEMFFTNKEIKDILQYTDVHFCTVYTMIEVLKVFGLAIANISIDNKEMTVLRMIVHMKNMLKQILYRQLKRTCTLRQAVSAYDAILQAFTSAEKEGLFMNVSQSLVNNELLDAITSTLMEMKDCIEKISNYQMFSGSTYENHVERIMTGEFELWFYYMILSLQNLHSAVYKTTADRIDAINSSEESYQPIERLPNEGVYFELHWKKSQLCFQF